MLSPDFPRKAQLVRTAHDSCSNAIVGSDGISVVKLLFSICGNSGEVLFGKVNQSKTPSLIIAPSDPNTSKAQGKCHGRRCCDSPVDSAREMNKDGLRVHEMPARLGRRFQSGGTLHLIHIDLTTKTPNRERY